MSVVVAVEATVIVLLALLVAGLLRSYAGLLKRIDAIEALPPSSTTNIGIPATREREKTRGRAANDLAGKTAFGDPLTIAVSGVAHSTLLAFLSSNCSSCHTFWADLGHVAAGDLPAGVRVVAVTKSGEQESPAAITELAPPDLDVIMSSQAWTDYGIPGSPYFVFVDGPTSAIGGEGTALEWKQVQRLMALASGDARMAAGVAGPSPKARPDTEREAEIDQVLMRAGVFPGDASLYRAPPPRSRD